MESAGLGICARSCGEGVLDIRDNTIYGTLAGEVTNAGETGDLGDGIGILTGTDGVPSVARISGNTVGGSIRLGIIVAGTGASAEVSETLFYDNGYGRLVEDATEAAPDLLYQGEATVTGADESIAQKVSGLLIGNDPAGPPPVFHGGGGEPTHE